MYMYQADPDESIDNMAISFTATGVSKIFQL